MNKIPEDYEPSWRTCALTFLASIPLIVIGIYVDHIVSYFLVIIGVLLSQSTVFLPSFSGLYDKGFNIFKDKWSESRPFLFLSPFWLIICIFISLSILDYDFGLRLGVLACVSFIISLFLMMIS